ncbi:MAG: hypothetical protein ACKOA1_02530 [Bacteroidota bacterium]
MKRILTFLLFLCLSFASVDHIYAQCAMCRRNVETNKMSEKSKVGTGLNKGILYLMSVPYIIGAVGIFMWVKRRKEQGR